MRPQLCTDVWAEEIDLDGLLSSPDWVMQEKVDGRHLMVSVDATGRVSAHGRGGDIVGVPGGVPVLRPGTMVDGEYGDFGYVIFDVLAIGGVDVSGLAYTDRMRAAVDAGITTLPVVATGKRDHMESLRAAGAEGVVFKRASGAHRDGRPATGGDWVRHKFTESCSAIAGESRGRSLEIGLADGSTIGRVCVPTVRDMPRPGDVVEIRYLYAHKSGLLCQPVYIGQRLDIGAPECIRSKIKPKKQ